MTKYPGEAFNIPSVVVGENSGTVTGSVHSKFLSLGKNWTAPDLEVFQHLQMFSQSTGCTEFPYTVLSENEKEDSYWYLLLKVFITTLYYGSRSEVDEMIMRNGVLQVENSWLIQFTLTSHFFLAHLQNS